MVAVVARMVALGCQRLAKLSVEVCSAAGGARSLVVGVVVNQKRPCANVDSVDAFAKVRWNHFHCLF